jgi:hypothetical protein
MDDRAESVAPTFGGCVGFGESADNDAVVGAGDCVGMTVAVGFVVSILTCGLVGAAGSFAPHAESRIDAAMIVTKILLVFIVLLLVNDERLGSYERMESPRRSPGCIDASNPFVDDRYRHERKKIVIF